MALRDQPYIPIFIQDIMTDEKLNECSASTHGIYIKGIMCLMHKSEIYGKLLLKQKYKQTESMSQNFALQICKHLPYSIEEITNAIDELIKEKVCYYENDYLCQKRMIKDNAINLVRSNAGKKGGGNPNFVSNLVKTKTLTKHEYEYVIEYNKKGIFIPDNFLKNGVPVEIWDQLKDEEKKNYSKMIWEEMLNSSTWIDEYCRQKKINVIEFKEQLKSFIIDCNSDESICKGLKEMKRHFQNKFQYSLKKN